GIRDATVTEVQTCALPIYLARSGFSGPKSVFEGRLGLLHAYSDAADPDRLLADMGKQLQVMRVSIKPYACCRYNHGLIDCVLRQIGRASCRERVKMRLCAV